MILPFDAHNHCHMGPTPPLRAMLPASDGAAAEDASAMRQPALSGMAIMSTHPRDYDRVVQLSESLPSQLDPTKSSSGRVRVVPCFGVHPWFLHELTESDWQPSTTNWDISSAPPKWIVQLEEMVKAHPNAIVGEIGLDGFHFCPKTNNLVSSMERQVEAFRLQLQVAARLERPVSVHTVQCFGPLMETVSQLKKKQPSRKQQRKWEKENPSDRLSSSSSSAPSLPPKWYFHAYGGKPGTIDQLLALCGTEPGTVYFGFAAVINFRSPKTAEVIRKVGLDRLVLETDHEDAAYVPHSMEQCIDFVAAALDVDRDTVIQRTTANAFDLYGLN